jgi:hypothetical protein
MMFIDRVARKSPAANAIIADSTQSLPSTQENGRYISGTGDGDGRTVRESHMLA